MPYKMKGTAMYDKMNVNGKTVMQLKKEYGGAMEMEHGAMKKHGHSAMDAARPDYPDIDGDGNRKESMKQAAEDKKSGMTMKHGAAMEMDKPMTEDVAMKMKAAYKNYKKGYYGA